MSELSQRMRDRWDAIWFAEGDLRPLALFRIGWAIAVLLEAYNEQGRFIRYSPDQFHWPLLDLASPVSVSQFQGLLWLINIGACLTLVGALPRLGALLVIYGQGYLFSISLLNFRNHIYLMVLMGLLLACAPCGRAWSVDNLVRRLWHGRPPSRRGSLLAQRLIQAQVLIAYLWAALHKINLDYLDGNPLMVELGKAVPKSYFGGWLANGPLGFLQPAVSWWLHDLDAMAIFSFTVILCEGMLVFGLPSASLRRYAIALGIAMHLGILAMMNVVTFGIMMISSYALFPDSGWLGALISKLRTTLLGPGPAAADP